MPMLTDGPNRRLKPRVEVAATAIVCRGKTYLATYLVENLSSGGALLAGDPRLHLGDGVRVLLQLAGFRPIALDARIVRREIGKARSSFAVAFEHASRETEALLGQVVRRALDRRQAGGGDGVLVLGGSPLTPALERDVAAIGFVSVTAATALEAVWWLQRPEPQIRAVLAPAEAPASDPEFVAFVAEEHPWVRRVWVRRHGGDAFAGIPGRIDEILDDRWDYLQLARALAS